jgi:endoglucanase
LGEIDAQEEIGHSGGGARTSAYALRPDVALVVDVTFSTDVPNIEKKELGEHRLGGGPVLTRGSASHDRVFEVLAEVADEEGIPYTIQASPRATRTDADGIFLTRGGVPTGLISVPNRYMPSLTTLPGTQARSLHAQRSAQSATCSTCPDLGEIDAQEGVV